MKFQIQAVCRSWEVPGERKEDVAEPQAASTQTGASMETYLEALDGGHHLYSPTSQINLSQ